MDVQLWWIGLGAVGIFAAAHFTYARFIARWMNVDDARTTPAVLCNDGVDHVPTPRGALFLQHFSAISAAGPIVGPIVAAAMFGWLPGLLWILFGCVVIGAVHDFAALTASVRHGAKTVAEIVREHVGREAWLLFVVFVWLALSLVVVNFTDVTAKAFLRGQLELDGAAVVPGPAVASSSMLYLLLALVMGLLQTKWRVSARIVAPLGVVALFALLWLGQAWPLQLTDGTLGLDAWRQWVLLILGYCCIASVAPMTLFLQPRGFLGGVLLWCFLVVGIIGLFFSGEPVRAAAFIDTPVQPLLPVLFVTIACGACSGFHGMVCSGTTSKQVAREGHMQGIGYGAMLCEGLVAIIALATFMIAAPSAKADPSTTFASGIARFAATLGIPPQLGLQFGFLALATFIYDTLDVCTRLGRYLLQELVAGTTPWKCPAWLATLITVAAPGALLLSGADYTVAWKVFGASNQLLAGLTLLAVAVWLRRTGGRVWFLLLPMAFILGITLTALVRDTIHEGNPPLLRGIAAALLVVGSTVLVMSLLRLRVARGTQAR